MWIIGLLLLAAAVVVGIEIGISSNDRQVDIEAFSHVWTSNAAAAFLVGVVTGVVGLFGLWLFFVGLRHGRVRRRSRRADIAERDRLADERRREIDAMGTTERGDRERERVPADRRDDDDVDLRDERRDDAGPRDERQRDDDGHEALEEHEAEDHRRGGILHRSQR